MAEGARAAATISVPIPRFNFRRTFGNQRFGKFDPTASLAEDVFEKIYHAPAGLFRARLALEDQALRLEIAGPRAEDELRRWVGFWPPDDGYSTFEPQQPLVNRLHRSLPGLRLLRQPWLFDITCQCILQQRVTWEEALRSWRRMVQAQGTRVEGALAFPAVGQVARMNPRSLREYDIDLSRARALVSLARAEISNPFLFEATPFPVLRKRLQAIPGIGPWTRELTLGAGAGDPDALPTGDLHLPHTVSWALAGEARGTDERMVELLEPYRGHRFRVIRLLRAAKLKAPKFAPKKPRRPPR